MLTPRRQETVLWQMRLRPLKVRVVDGADRPVAGVKVQARLSWSSPSGPASANEWSLGDEEQVLGPTDKAGWCSAPLPITTDWLKLWADHERITAKDTPRREWRSPSSAR